MNCDQIKQFKLVVRLCNELNQLCRDNKKRIKKVRQNWINNIYAIGSYNKFKIYKIHSYNLHMVNK